MRKESTINPKVAVFWVIVMVSSVIAFYFGSIHIFESEGSFKIDFEASWYWLLATVGGIFFLLIATWQLSADQIGGISVFFARLSSRRIGPISHYIPKSIHANTRNIKNLIGFLTLGVALVTSLTILSDSISLGNKAGGHTYLGGDATIFYPFVPRSVIPSVNDIPGIDGATVYTGVVMDNWKFNFDTAYSYVVNNIDDYGGKNNGEIQNLNVVVIEPDEYLSLNPPSSPIHNEFDHAIPSVYEIDAPNPFESPSDFIHRLDTPMTTIVNTRLLDTLGKDIDDDVMLSVNGFIGKVKIVGAASSLPAAPYMRLMDMANYSSRTLIISRATFENIVGNFIGNADIFIKNMTIPASLMNHTVSERAAGYTSGLIDMNAINSTIHGVAGVDKTAYRFSTFAPGAPSLNATFESSQLVWKHQNITISDGDEFPLPMRMFVLDGREDLFMSGWQQQVMASSSFASASYTPPSDPEVRKLLDWNYAKRVDSTAASVLYLIDHFVPQPSSRSTFFDGNALCVVNQYAVAYQDIDNETYVYEMKPNDVIKFSMELDNGTIASFNFSVAATIDNHLSYWWQNGTMREGFKLSSKALNYNFKANVTGDLQDLFDVDANVFLTTRNELMYVADEMFGSGAYFLGIPELNNVKADELANHVHVKVSPGYNVTDVALNIKNALDALSPTTNCSVFVFKQTLVGKLVNSGALAISIEPLADANVVLSLLETWYKSNGYDWNIAHVGTIERESIGSDIGVAEPVFRIFFVVAIFSLLISAVGLCTIIYANARKRHREFGIYKAIGYSNAAVREMIFFETFMVTALGIIAGTLAGIVMMGILFQSITESMIIPMTFSIPIWTLVSVVAMLFIVATGTSKLISNHVAKLSIAENIRYRE